MACHLFDQELAHQSGSKRAVALALDGRHCAASIYARRHATERQQVRINVQRGAEIRDPVAYGDSDFRDWSRTNRDTRMAGERTGPDTEMVEDVSHRQAKLFEVSVDSQTKPIQREYRVKGELSRAVKNATATPIHPANRETAGSVVLDVAVDVCPATAPANRDQRWVFTEQERGAVPVRSHLVDQATLKRERPFKIHHAQKVDAQRRSCRFRSTMSN